jgi:hypothetical protein
MVVHVHASLQIDLLNTENIEDHFRAILEQATQQTMLCKVEIIVRVLRCGNVVFRQLIRSLR